MLDIITLLERVQMLAFLFPYTRNIGNRISNCGGIPLRAGAADDHVGGRRRDGYAGGCAEGDWVI
jgi:hypothetical protein